MFKNKEKIWIHTESEIDTQLTNAYLTNKKIRKILISKDIYVDFFKNWSGYGCVTSKQIGKAHPYIFYSSTVGRHEVVIVEGQNVLKVEE